MIMAATATDVVVPFGSDDEDSSDSVTEVFAPATPPSKKQKLDTPSKRTLVKLKPTLGFRKAGGRTLTPSDRLRKYPELKSGHYFAVSDLDPELLFCKACGDSVENEQKRVVEHISFQTHTGNLVKGKASGKAFVS